jgi:ArsR family metal-binding transcriptional regulator
MLLKSFQTKFVRPPNPTAQHLRCFACFEDDISAALPYLNTVLKGHEFSLEPPSLTIKYPGKLITLTSREIAINIVKDQDEAREILEWLQGEINAAWERRAEITPNFQVAAAPRVLNILKLLPRSNCGACGQPTCMVFAVQVSQGAQGPGDCTQLDPENLGRLQEYLRPFQPAD